MKKRKKGKNIGFLFVLPWVTGMCLFGVVPLVASVFISMTDWGILGDFNYIGLQNYIDIFNDEIFYVSLWVTVRYAIFAVPLTICTALLIAVFLNIQTKAVGFFRSVFYMPSLVSGVAVAVVFKWILDPNYGLINSVLNIFGIKGPNWLFDPNWVLPSYLVMAFWGACGGYLTYLAALKDIPKELYEAAKIEGAGFIKRTTKITVPLLSPIIFYNTIMGIISAFRKFSDAYVLGGAGDEGRFYMVNLYQEAFSIYKMGYATALAWILFVIIMDITIVLNITNKYWVYSD